MFVKPHWRAQNWCLPVRRAAVAACGYMTMVIYSRRTPKGKGKCHEPEHGYITVYNTVCAWARYVQSRVIGNQSCETTLRGITMLQCLEVDDVWHLYSLSSQCLEVDDLRHPTHHQGNNESSRALVVQCAWPVLWQSDKICWVAAEIVLGHKRRHGDHTPHTTTTLSDIVTT
jgi:hypothetical protein